MTATLAPASEQAMFDERLPVGRTLVIGFQHVLVMMPGTIAVPLILASAIGLNAADTSLLVSANFLAVGVTTMIHALGFGRIGTRLPIIFGSSFAPLGPMIMIGKNYGMGALFGAIIGSGVLILASTFFLEKVLALFPKVVVGCFVTLIGVSLAPTALTDLAGGFGSESFGSPRNLALGFGVLITIALLERFGRGMVSVLALLIGMIGGGLVGLALGMVDTKAVADASWFAVVPPFHFGVPEFHPVPILLMTLFCLMNVLQCIGGYSVLDDLTGSHTSRAKVVDGVRAQAVGQIFAGSFNSVACTIFKENLGLLGITKVKSRWVIVTAAAMALLLGFLPKIATLLTAIPKPVVGGATLYLFGVVTAAGLSILSSLDFGKNHHFTIIGTSLAVGIGAEFVGDAFSQLPETLSMLLSDGLFMVAFTAVTLNLLYNGVRTRPLETDVSDAGTRSRHVPEPDHASSPQ